MCAKFMLNTCKQFSVKKYLSKLKHKEYQIEKFQTKNILTPVCHCYIQIHVLY